MTDLYFTERHLPARLSAVFERPRHRIEPLGSAESNKAVDSRRYRSVRHPRRVAPNCGIIENGAWRGSHRKWPRPDFMADPMRDADSVELRPQLGLFPEFEPAPLSRGRRLWIVAAERSLVISQRHRYAFVDSLDGTSVVQRSDMLLLRNHEGEFGLFGPADEPCSFDMMEAFSAALPDKIARSCLNSGSRTAITEMMAVSSRPARWRDSSKAESRSENARSSLEEILFRLEQYPSNPAQLSTLGSWNARLGASAHPMVRALFHRIYADALAGAYRHSGEDYLGQRARLNYLLAQSNSLRAGLFHHLRTAYGTSRSALARGQLEFPGFEARGARLPSSIGFSVERICGFAIALDDLFAPNFVGSTVSSTAAYRHYGTLRLTDTQIVRSLTGLQSPSRRLVASTRSAEGRITVTTGVVDEFRALLRVAGETEPEVKAIQASSDTISFAPPWTVSPSDFVTFIGRPDQRRHHQVSVRAVMADGLDLHLGISLDVKNTAPEHHL